MFSPDEIEKTRQLLELFASNKLSELSVTDDNGFSVEIVSCSSSPVVITPSFPTQVTPTNRPASQPASKSTGGPKTTGLTLNSPMVGIFYSAASPGDPPFVSVGDIVTVGQTIGLIEAMKVFSEIPAEVRGRIVETLAVSGNLVQQAEPLFRIEPV